MSSLVETSSKSTKTVFLKFHMIYHGPNTASGIGMALVACGGTAPLPGWLGGTCPWCSPPSGPGSYTYDMCMYIVVILYAKVMGLTTYTSSRKIINLPYRGVQFSWMGDLATFRGSIFADAHDCAIASMYKHAYFVGLFFAVQESITIVKFENFPLYGINSVEPPAPRKFIVARTMLIYYAFRITSFPAPGKNRLLFLCSLTLPYLENHTIFLYGPFFERKC